MNVLIIDDHQLFIDGMSYLLRGLGTPLNLCTADNTELALEQLQSGTDWDLVLLDLVMPGISGRGVLQRMQAQGMPYPVVVISAELNSSLIQQALNLGALGFIPKAYPREAMLTGLRQVLGGEMYIPEEVQLALERLPSSGVSGAPALLSKRQSQVLQLLEQGNSNQQIAQVLFISESTVKTHLNTIFQILQVSNRVSCLQRAREMGLVGDGVK